MQCEVAGGGSRENQDVLSAYGRIATLESYEGIGGCWLVEDNDATERSAGDLFRLKEDLKRRSRSALHYIERQRNIVELNQRTCPTSVHVGHHPEGLSPASRQ